ncbi:PREDICTED: uncharacterized protein LOC109580225 [Amphimedon queenslandica]|uniref:Uncharacterized protein n=1 Tax=Amphimedon queenslandica TaxID=400682 RepID=A0A1X7VIJ5_AMPQE|nr:PREDICTED: uncharacterized protein LOC109580225 [Amphimedon queenslandica]|eukprot:XP_019848728.1 PREDICTED: uncharacterized protein LOC109580225 [Amphimedon queenslandica]
MNKRPVAGPFPMFGKVNQQGRGRGGSNAKRPRVALYSHPNNIIGEEAAIPPSTWSSNTSSTGSWNWREAAEKKWPPQAYRAGTRGRGRGGYSNVIDRKRTNQENVQPVQVAAHSAAAGPTNSYYSRNTTSHSYPPLPPPHCVSYPPPGGSRSTYNAPSQYNQQPLIDNTQPTTSQQPTVRKELGQEREGQRYIEQPKKMLESTTSSKGVMAGGKGRALKKGGGISRVITTTGQGIQQWNLLNGTQEHLTFELFGTAISLVTAGEFGCQQFLLKTSSGTVKCCYWEMGVKFSPIIKGRSYRVVGNWDSRHQFLKTASLRPSEQEEEQFLPQVLTATNKLIRELAAITNEQ